MICKAKWQPLNHEAKFGFSFGCCVRGLGFSSGAASITHQLQVYESDNLRLWKIHTIADLLKVHLEAFHMFLVYSKVKCEKKTH